MSCSYLATYTRVGTTHSKIQYTLITVYYTYMYRDDRCTHLW